MEFSEIGRKGQYWQRAGRIAVRRSIVRCLSHRIDFCGRGAIQRSNTLTDSLTYEVPTQTDRCNQPMGDSTAMTDANTYTPPKVWTWNKANGGRFANINRPTAGATHDKQLPVGRHPLQLYSQATPNGVKVTVLLEELLALGHHGAEYDAWLIRISDGDQFGSGFVAVNPNSKIPALMDRSGATPIRVFESGAILLYLAEKFRAFLPIDAATRAECLSWLFWQMGSAPYLGGGFGHFYSYAPTKIEYAIDRFAMEVKRQLDVLNRRLAVSEYLSGKEYTIADMAVWPWYGALAQGLVYGAAEFLQVQEYTHVQRWAESIANRPAVKRGRKVNCISGDLAGQLHERHDARDFETHTQDKIQAEKT
jgi:GSH-dependent disulfide-bond oxidoreductase